MGTSSRYSAPTGGHWTTAKTRMTNWTKGGGQSNDVLRRSLAEYVTALGGARSAASRSTGGVRAAGGLGGFLADVGRDGLDATLDAYQLTDLVGGDPTEVINEIAERIVGSGDTVEEAVARDAVLEVLGELFAEADTFEEMDQVQISEDGLRDLLARYLNEYIYRRVLQALGDRIRDNAASDAEAARLEASTRDLISSLVSLDLSTLDPLTFDWQGAEGRDRMQQLLEDAFRLVGEAA
jgi:hypothetical protein